MSLPKAGFDAIDIGHGAIVVLNLDTGDLRRTLDGDPSTKGTRPMIVEGKELPPVFGLGRILDVARRPAQPGAD